MAKWNIYWGTAQSVITIGFQCGFCGLSVASEKGWLANIKGGSQILAHIRICPNCNLPTLFDPHGNQIPGVLFGKPVAEIPDKSLTALYEEARKTTGSNCYTSAVLCCRKLLMHIAVSKGANPGDSFIKYVEFLADNNYVPPDAKDWVDHIRKKETKQITRLTSCLRKMQRN